MVDGVVRVLPDETERAVLAIEEDGCVMLESAIPVQPLAVLRRCMDRDTHDLLRFCETIGGNPCQAGHLQQGPPPFADYVFPEVAMLGGVDRVQGPRGHLQRQTYRDLVGDLARGLEASLAALRQARGATCGHGDTATREGNRHRPAHP